MLRVRHNGTEAGFYVEKGAGNRLNSLREPWFSERQPPTPSPLVKELLYYVDFVGMRKKSGVL